MSPGGKGGHGPAPAGLQGRGPPAEPGSAGARAGGAGRRRRPRERPAHLRLPPAGPRPRSPPAAEPAGLRDRSPPAAVSSPQGPGRARLWWRSAAVGVQRPARAPMACGARRRWLMRLRCPFASPLLSCPSEPSPTSAAQSGHPHECPGGLCCFRTRSLELVGMEDGK